MISSKRKKLTLFITNILIINSSEGKDCSLNLRNLSNEYILITMFIASAWLQQLKFNK
jgi:hypothetical protein